MLLKQSRLDVVPETKSIRTVVLHDVVSESESLNLEGCPGFRSPDEAMITVNWSHRCFDHARSWCGLFYYLPIDLWLRFVVGRGLRYTFFPSMNFLSGVNAFFRTAPLTYFSFLQCFLVQRRDTLVLERPDW